jgi:hypothetical protein
MIMKMNLTILVAAVWAVSMTLANAESGYQTIRGTQVYTVIDHARGVATFSNQCGSQTLTQAQLQAGAYPDKIIPCNPPQTSTPPQQFHPQQAQQSDPKVIEQCGDISNKLNMASNDPMGYTQGWVNALFETFKNNCGGLVSNWTDSAGSHREDAITHVQNYYMKPLQEAWRQGQMKCEVGESLFFPIGANPICSTNAPGRGTPQPPSQSNITGSLDDWPSTR